jgi:type IV fimbrial biogenesis protein FimT
VSLQKGVTLVEMLVVVAILALVSSWAVPAYRNLVDANQIRAARSTLLSFLAETRMEAAKRGRPMRVTARPKGTGETCTGWQCGAEAKADVNGVETLILSTGVLPSSVSVQTSATAFSGYRANGMTISGNGHTFTLCVAGGRVRGTQIDINAGGRVREREVSCG